MNIFLILLLIFGVFYSFSESKKARKIKEFKKFRKKYLIDLITNENRLTKIRKNFYDKIQAQEDFFLKIIYKHFSINLCTACNEDTHILNDVNSKGTGLQICCLCCSKKKWIKSIDSNKDTEQLVGIFEKLDAIRDKENPFYKELIDSLISDAQEFLKYKSYPYFILEVFSKDKKTQSQYSGEMDSTQELINAFSSYADLEYNDISISAKKLNSNFNTKKRKITQQVMDKVWNRDKGKCVRCGSNKKIEFDHIIPFSKGGANTYRNIQVLCEFCNRTKSAKIGE